MVKESFSPLHDYFTLKLWRKSRRIKKKNNRFNKNNGYNRYNTIERFV